MIRYNAYSPRHKTRYDTSHLVKIHDQGVEAHKERRYRIEVEIPGGVDIPNLINCTIINCNFELEVEAILPMPHTNLRVKIPVILGQNSPVPLGGYGFQAAPVTVSAVAESSRGLPSGILEVPVGKPMPMPPLPNLYEPNAPPPSGFPSAPPSYEDALANKVN